MQKKKKFSELLAKPAVCLALGSIGMVIIMCGFINFSIHSVVGKIAVYLCWLLMAFSIFVLILRERSVGMKRKSSGKMLRFRLLCVIAWHLATGLLLTSLLLIILGMELSNVWVRNLCVVGVCLAPVSWLGVLLCLHRGWQAAALRISQEEHQPE